MSPIEKTRYATVTYGVMMIKRRSDYHEIVVQSVMGKDSQGRPKRQIRPIIGQLFGSHLNVECSIKLIENYPLGTRFKLKAKLTATKGTPFLYSYFGWPVTVVR